MSMRQDHYDIIIIGSGAGGGTIAYALADSGARILVIERGGVVPQEDANWSPEAVWKDLRYRVPEQWLDPMRTTSPTPCAINSTRRRMKARMMMSLSSLSV